MLNSPRVHGHLFLSLPAPTLLAFPRLNDLRSTGQPPLTPIVTCLPCTLLSLPFSSRISLLSLFTFSSSQLTTEFFASTACLLSIMDRGLSTGTHQQHDGLRERNAPATTAAPSVDTLAASGEVASKDKAEGDGKTFGRTPDGTGMLFLFFSLYFFWW